MATNLELKIQRIANNVRNALTKIATKGVTVPSGANSDDLETLIDEIPSPSYETWVFEMESGDTVEKEVAVE